MSASLTAEGARMLAACDLVAEPAADLDVEAVAERVARLTARLLACEVGLVVLEGPDGTTVRSYPGATGHLQAQSMLDLCAQPGQVFDGSEFGSLAAGAGDGLGVSFEAAGRYRGVVAGLQPARGPFGALDEWLLLVTGRRIASQLETVALHLDRLADQQLVIDARLAGELQQQLIGRFPPAPGLDISGVLRPARHVGGDLYWWHSDAGGTTVAVADVSGKGASAALLTASLQASLRHAVALGETRPAGVIEHVRVDNGELLDRTSRLVTLAVARFDRNGMFSISSAGQSPVVLRRNGRSELVAPHMPPLGAPSRPVAESVLALTADDTLLIGTDGLIDQRDEHGSQFGVNRLLRTVDAATGTAGQMADQVLARIAGHGGGMPQEDDTTLVVVRREDSVTC